MAVRFVHQYLSETEVRMTYGFAVTATSYAVEV